MIDLEYVIETLSEMEETAQDEVSARLPDPPTKYNKDTAFSYGYWLGKVTGIGEAISLLEEEE